MNHNTLDCSCLIVSRNHKNKAAIVNATITSSAAIVARSERLGYIDLKFHDACINETMYKMLDREFDFGLDFAMSDSANRISKLLPRVLESLPDAKLLVVQGSEADTVVGITHLYSMRGKPEQKDSALRIPFSGVNVKPHYSVAEAQHYVGSLTSIGNSSESEVLMYEAVSTREGRVT